MGELEEEYDYQHEIEPDEHTLNENIKSIKILFRNDKFSDCTYYPGHLFQ